MENHQPTENLIQGGATGELEEKKLWKERLREEILEEEKERIMNYVESEITKKAAEIEMLLEFIGKPAKLVVLPIDYAHFPKQKLLLEQGSSLSHHLVNNGNGISSSPATLDADIKGGSEIGLDRGSQVKRSWEGTTEKEKKEIGSACCAENTMIPVEEAKAEVQPSEEKEHMRPIKKQKTGFKWSCPLCGVTATSESNLNKHFMGKKHKIKSSKIQRVLKSDPVDATAVKEIPTNGLSMKMQANGKLFMVYKKGKNLWCKNNNCNFTCANTAEMVLHLSEPEHDQLCENGEEGRSGNI